MDSSQIKKLINNNNISKITIFSRLINNNILLNKEMYNINNRLELNRLKLTCLKRMIKTLIYSNL